jgi:hypothetical protein
MADSLLSGPQCRPGTWKMSSSWTLPSGVHYQPETKTNEGRLVRSSHGDSDPNSDSASHSAPVGLLLPLSLPEWKRGCTQGSLKQSGNRILYESHSPHTRQCNAVLLALGKASSSKQFTWRPLTIAQDLKIVAEDAARAFRVQIDRDQWVFYRSLTPCTRRTVMGLHLNMEFYAGRFTSSDGTYEPLVEVSPD